MSILLYITALNVTRNPTLQVEAGPGEYTVNAKVGCLEIVLNRSDLQNKARSIGHCA